jgi:hypothetical protein
MAVAIGTSGSSVTNSLSLVVNVGDVVAVLVNNADNTQPTNLIDDGGNFYTLVARDSASVRGFSSLYVCNGAKFSATTISFDAGHSPTMQAITFSGATGIGGILTTGNSAGSTTAQASTTTKIANDVACTMMTFFSSGTAITPSAGTGSLQTSHASTASLAGGAIVATASASIGAHNGSVTLSGSAPWFAWSFEVWPAVYIAKLPQGKKSTGGGQAGWGMTR